MLGWWACGEVLCLTLVARVRGLQFNYCNDLVTISLLSPVSLLARTSVHARPIPCMLLLCDLCLDLLVNVFTVAHILSARMMSPKRLSAAVRQLCARTSLRC